MVGGCSPTFVALEQCSRGSLSMLQTDGGGYLHVVASMRLFLVCTKLTRFVEFYDVTGVLLVSLLLS